MTAVLKTEPGAPRTTGTRLPAQAAPDRDAAPGAAGWHAIGPRLH
jgi:hypothetical protein